MKFIVSPGQGLLKLAIVMIALGLLVAIWPALESLWLGAMVVLVLFVIYDLIRVVRMQPPQLERELPSAMAVGLWHNVRILLQNPNQHSLRLQVFDHFPDSAQFKGLPQSVVLAAEQQASIEYRCRPLERGLVVFPGCQCRLESGFRCWQISHDLVLESRLKVYPNYTPVIEYALLSMENHLSLMGILKHRRRGQGMDFHQLREFREGDSLKQIDWKATSRMRKIIAREYQDERDQEILLLMDCGHRMLNQDGDLSHFDHSLNALLLLSYVALRQGDAVGVATFSHDQGRWIKPVKGVANINRLLNGIYDLQPSSQAPDYSSGAKQLLLRHRKRSLVIILTNLRDDDADDLQAAVSLLKKHHRIVVVSLQEQAVNQILEQEVMSLDDALTVSATHGYLRKRQQLVQLLQKQGVKTLDVLPEKLPLALTNCYLDLKVSGQT